jgi:type I restriction-modification system DNA methylase subunit
MPRKRRASVNQLDLIPNEAAIEGWWRCQGIFARPYLNRFITDREQVPTTDEVRPLFEKIKSRWLDNLPGLRRQGEPYTRTKFIDPTLIDLGWSFIPEKNLPHGNTRKRPDYCVFADQETEKRVAASDATEIFRASSTVIEAKKTQHSLDEVSRTETPGWFPSQQIQDYLRWATDSSGRRFFRWGVLTNGNEWRVYCSDAAPDAYFSFHLAYGEQFCPLEEFRLFVALFRPSTFDRDDQSHCLLDAIRDQSLNQQVELESNLRKRIFDVLEELAEGYFNNPANRLVERDFGAVYETSLIFLYRLLFILYAESRGVLPAKPRGPGSNKRYREEFALTRFVDKLRDRTNYPDDAFDGLYKELLKLFHLVNGTNKAQNERLGVTRYNGGLFNPDHHPYVERWWVGEKTLANVLRQLIFAQPPPRGRARQLVISTDETLDYSTLEVRQLGDIYEGLLGGRLQVGEGGHLELVNERGLNQRQGIFYTPDWVVVYLIRETLQPLLDTIESGSEVQAALNGKSTERRRDNSFALAVLRLNLVDPAMGSGHFLVRATEFLAQKIVGHSTTRTVTEKIVSTGDTRRTREQILADGRIPVPPGVSQEQAEIAYWRRRVVEACIYGVDSNPLAVELAKLSLWLTCIAVDEPLNFLDHHLRHGNSLLAANPDELHRLPFHSEADARQATFDIGNQLTTTLRDVIDENVNIEAEASTEMEIVKHKEDRWKKVREKLQPFLDTADLWLAALDGLPVNDLDYRNLTLAAINHRRLSAEEKHQINKLRESLKIELAAKKDALQSFHWYLEFPSVFYGADGQPLSKDNRGFDAVLGNPPYISTHTSSEQKWRSAIERRFGYLEDLYVHFTDLGFSLLRPGGTFGFIVSDTFFTLASKLRMRELLQHNSLTHLGQCDPFEATVDAAIFVARKGPVADKNDLLFIQARHRSDRSQPEKELPRLPAVAQMIFPDETPGLGVRHTSQGCLRLHHIPVRIYREALKRAFFEPNSVALEFYRRFNRPVKKLVGDWWDRIENSQKFSDNLVAIRNFNAGLKPGAITLVGLIAEGGQGLATANNARFLGYLANTPQAEAIKAKRQEWTGAWLAQPRIKSAFLQLLEENGGDPNHPTKNTAAWEACVEPLKLRFDQRRDLGFIKTDLYRVVPQELVAAKEDFLFTWERRKAQLLAHWQVAPLLSDFWEQRDLLSSTQPRNLFRRTKTISDEEFCKLCQHLLAWWQRENEKRKSARPRTPLLPRESLGLRSSENYTDPVDAPRIATIYNGLSGRARWLPFRKGDPEGNRWLSSEFLFIEWTEDNVIWLFENSGRKGPNMPVIRNPHLYFTQAVNWQRTGRDTPLKVRIMEPCIYDSECPVIIPITPLVSVGYLACVLNSNVVTFFIKRFINNTKYELSDLRMLPLVMPNSAQAKRLVELAERALAAKQLTFTGALPSNDLVAYVRQVIDELTPKAPKYLNPPAQLRLLSTAADCLATIELAVNWEVEKLYGVEGLGPFEEF